jgi:hypothetical protein
VRLRARSTTPVIPGEEWATVGFDAAEPLGTVHYGQAADAARQARTVFAAKGEQFPLFEAA